MIDEMTNLNTIKQKVTKSYKIQKNN